MNVNNDRSIDHACDGTRWIYPFNSFSCLTLSINEPWLVTMLSLLVRSELKTKLWKEHVFL